ncbi:MAG: YceI family protein [Holophagales bacterium]|nr:YceI family protein [Holophagales bacterium]
MKSSRIALLTMFASILLLAAGSATAEERQLRLDPAQSEVAFDLPATGHDVHGIFVLSDGAVRFDPETGVAAGEIRVDLAGGASGNGSRDRTMREDVLEAEKFPFATYRIERVAGELKEGGTSTLRLIGVLSVHGSEHPLEVDADVALRGEQVVADVTFPVPFVEWGMKDPSILFLRVDKSVAVKVHAVGALGAVPERVASGG